jgi:hypothetical protein
MKTLGTIADAKREHRLVEYYEQSALALNADEDAVQAELAKPANKRARCDLVIASVERGVPCRFLTGWDYDQFVPEVSYPGPEYVVDTVCSAGCKWSLGDPLDCLTIPASTKTCPFCGAPTKPTMGQEFIDKHLAEREANNRA